MAIDQNKLAILIGERDSGTERCSLGQRKQIIKLTLDAVAQHPLPEVQDLLSKHGAPDEWRLVPKKGFVVMKFTDFLGYIVSAGLLVALGGYCLASVTQRDRCSTQCACGCRCGRACTCTTVKVSPPTEVASPAATPVAIPDDPPVNEVHPAINARELANRVGACCDSSDHFANVIECTLRTLAKMLDAGELQEHEVLDLIKAYRHEQ